MQGTSTTSNQNQSKLFHGKTPATRNPYNGTCNKNTTNNDHQRWLSEPFDFIFLVLLPLLVLSLIGSDNLGSLSFRFPSFLVFVPFLVLRVFYFLWLFCHLKSLAGKVFRKVRGSLQRNGSRNSGARVCFKETTVIRPVPERKLSRVVRITNSDLSEEYFSSFPRKDHYFSSMLADGGLPISESSSPFVKSPWSSHGQFEFEDNNSDKPSQTALLGSIIREQGHIYSLAVDGNLLYTGSDSKNIRVWKDRKEFSGFKSNSGLVKAIVIAGAKIFTGHQDGKIRVWKISSKSPNVHRRVATLPTLKDFIRSSIKPSSYVEVSRNRSGLWLKHFDAISCLCLNEDKTLLYSASWDKTFKVWRVSDSRCIESVTAHDDAVNSVVVGFDGLVFTGSADGTVKVWRRELQGKGTKHFFSQTLLKHECAVTAIAINPEATIIYSGSSDGLLNFWEREKNLEHGGLLRSHKLAILCLATVANLVFSGSADMSIWVWKRNGTNHSTLSVLSGHTGPVKCLAVEEDHETAEAAWILYSGSLDKSVKMWRVTDQPAPDLPPPVDSSHGTRTLAANPSFSTQGRISAAKEG